mgnify:FL=1|jgi:hypothetical protein
MVKKIFIAGLFLGGGVFFIKKILPMLSGDVDSFEAPEEDAFEITKWRGGTKNTNYVPLEGGGVWERPDFDPRDSMEGMANFSGSALKSNSKKEFIYLNQI